MSWLRAEICALSEQAAVTSSSFSGSLRDDRTRESVRSTIRPDGGQIVRSARECRHCQRKRVCIGEGDRSGLTPSSATGAGWSAGGNSDGEGLGGSIGVDDSQRIKGADSLFPK